MAGETNLSKLISAMSPSLLADEFVFVSLAYDKLAQLEGLLPFASFQEKEGLSLILKKTDADTKQFAYDGIFKCITLNIHSSLDAVGLTAAVSTALAEVNISANVVAAYYHDHIFVGKQDANKALHQLNALTQHTC